MEPVIFSCTGQPRGKGRPRATVRGKFASMYTDPVTRKYEAAVKGIARDAMGGRAPFEGPVSVSLRFRFQPAKSLPKYVRARLLAGEEAYLGTTDLDNLAKSILDGCNTVCFRDDVQVVRLFVTKIAAEKPGVDVRIEPLAPQGASA